MAKWEWNRGEYDQMDKEQAAQLRQENITLQHNAWLAARAEREKIADWLCQCGQEEIGLEVRNGYNGAKEVC